MLITWDGETSGYSLQPAKNADLCSSLLKKGTKLNIAELFEALLEYVSVVSLKRRIFMFHTS